MSKSRQRAILDDRARGTADVTTLVWKYRAGHVVRRHFHEEHQLVSAASGAMTVETTDATWVVPPLRAVWIPARMPHSIRMTGPVTMETLYFAPQVGRSLPKACFVLGVSPLLRALVGRICGREKLERGDASDRRLLGVVLDEIADAHSLPLVLPLPSDPRALRLARKLLEDPSERASLSDLCRKSGASARTIERVFTSETRMPFGRWRQQLRIAHALRSMAGGASVTTAALDAGYSTPSAFVVAFRNVFGTTPRAYLTRGS